MDVGRLLRDTRLQHGLDQAQLAQRAGTTQTYISRVERGAVSPSTTTLARLFAAMGLRLSLTLEPLEHGNVSADRLRADWRERSAKERVDEAIELSEFLTGVAASAADARTGHDTR
jgi:transcriptional regulator with XRE-family HTH domain